MKKRIIKVRVLGLLVILVLTTVLFYKNIYWTGIRFYNGIVSEDQKIILAEAPTYTLKDEMLRLEIMVTDREYRLYQLTRIGQGMMTSGAHVSSHDALKTLEQFKYYNKGEALYSKEIDYCLNVILLQWFAGNVEETKMLLDKLVLEDLNDKQLSEYHLIWSAINLSEVNLLALETHIEGIVYDAYQPVKIGLTDFVARFYHNDYKKSVIEFNNDDAKVDQYTGYFANVFQLLRQSNSDYLDNKETRLLGQKVSGYVTLNGQAVPGAFVYPKYRNGMSSNEGFNNELCVTDENGYYELEEAKFNLRDINIAVPWQVFHNKQIKCYRGFEIPESGAVTRDFNFYDGISFKTLSVENGYLSYEISDVLANEDRKYYFLARPLKDASNVNYTSIAKAFTNNQLTGQIAVEELRNYTDMAINYSSSSDQLAIERFIEPLYLAGDYIFSIGVSDSERNSYTWNGLSTESLSSIVFVDGEGGYNKGDLLLSEKKIDEAKEWYEKNPSRHNLNVLIALYSRGTQIVETEFDQKLTGAEPEKAIPYLEELIENYGSTDRRRNDLARLYKVLGDFDNEERVLLENLGITPSVYDYFALAYNYFNQGRYAEATDLLLEHGDMAVDGDRYYSYFIIGDQIEYLPKHLKNNLERIEQRELFKDFFELVEAGKTLDAYNWLLKQEKSDLKNFYVLNLIDSFHHTSWNEDAYELISFADYKAEMNIEENIEFIDYYRRIYERTKDPNLKACYQYINKDNGWLNL